MKNLKIVKLSAEIVLLIGLQIKNRILKDKGNDKSFFYVKYVVFYNDPTNSATYIYDFTAVELHKFFFSFI